MDLNLTGARVIITAGASGIGLETARAFVEEGARVAVCDVDAEAVARLSETHPALHARIADVTDRPGIAAFIAEAAEGMGGLDVLVNNAGIAGPTAGVEDVDPGDWDRCLDVCLTGQFNCVQAALPRLRKSDNASIINLSSAAGRLGFGMRTPYAAAKWGVVGLTKSLAVELGPEGIRCNAILPGLVAGDRIRRVIEAKAQRRGMAFADAEAEALSKTSMRTYVTQRQLADQILLLCSERGRTISGQAVSICGDTQMLM
jgi:NAD(P)-dependent dehydrogenase (short-subunit alcohol dehydrogenase family)